MKTINLLMFTAIFALPVLSNADNNSNTSGANSWQQTKHGITLYLRQLTNDQVNAFYIGRGFTLEQIKPYADTCVYTTVLRNDNAPGRIHFLRSNWIAKTKNNSQNIRSTSEWLKIFKQSDVPASALIAFRLAQIPEEQEYEPVGDWNQGMLSIDLLSGSLDIIVNWDIEGKNYNLEIQGVSCVK